MSITRTGPDALISVEQAAEILTMTKQTVRRRISDGSLPAYRIAGQPTIRVWRSDVEALLQPIPATARLERVQVRGGGVNDMTITIPTQKPSDGCRACGGDVRTYKRNHGWICAKCVKAGAA